MGSNHEDQKKIAGKSRAHPSPRYFSLKWNGFENQLQLVFSELYMTKEFTDVTLVSDGQAVRAHKIVLSMCSPYFRQILKENPLKHPTVIIDGVSPGDLCNVLEFMYLGRISVQEDEIQSFIETAEFLKVDGVETKQRRHQSPNVPPIPSCSSNEQPASKMTHHIHTLLEGHHHSPLNLSRVSPSFDQSGTLPQPMPISEDDTHRSSQPMTMPMNPITALHNLNMGINTSRPSSPGQMSHQQILWHNSVVSHRYKANHGHSYHHSRNHLVSSRHNFHTHTHHHHHQNPHHNNSHGNGHGHSNNSHHSILYKKHSNKKSVQSKPLNLAPKRQRERKSKTGSSDTSKTKDNNDVDDMNKESNESNQEETNSNNLGEKDKSINKNRTVDMAAEEFAQETGAEQAQPQSGEYQLSIKQIENSPENNHVRLFTTDTGIVVSALGYKANTLWAQRQKEAEAAVVVQAGQQQTELKLNGSEENRNNDTTVPTISIPEDDNDNQTRISPFALSPASPGRLQIVVSPPAVSTSPSRFRHFPINLNNVRADAEESCCNTNNNNNIGPTAIPVPYLEGSPVHRKSLHHNFPISSLSPPSSTNFNTMNLNSNSNSSSNSSSSFKTVISHYSAGNSNNSGYDSSSIGSNSKDSHISSSSTSAKPLKHSTSVNSPSHQHSKSKNGGGGSKHSTHTSNTPGSQPLKYTSAEVRALVDAVANVNGMFVPCKLCEKVVKRERLRSHIYECHLVNGQKINCPYCGVGLKSKGSYRVHVWRHRKGSLKNSGGPINSILNAKDKTNTKGN